MRGSILILLFSNLKVIFYHDNYKYRYLKDLVSTYNFCGDFSTGVETFLLLDAWKLVLVSKINLLFFQFFELWLKCWTTSFKQIIVTDLIMYAVFARVFSNMMPVFNSLIPGRSASWVLNWSFLLRYFEPHFSIIEWLAMSQWMMQGYI